MTQIAAAIGGRHRTQAAAAAWSADNRWRYRAWAASMKPVDADLDLGDGLRLRPLTTADSALLAGATREERRRSLWGVHPAGPYSLRDAQAALAVWDPAAGGQFSLGLLHGGVLLGAVGLMPDGPGSIELAYWVAPAERGRGLASRAVLAVTPWAHGTLAATRLWLEIAPGNEPSLRLARRTGYRFEQRIPRHCRDWVSEDAEHDSWHDCLIWVHTAGSAPGAAGQAAPG